MGLILRLIGLTGNSPIGASNVAQWDFLGGGAAFARTGAADDDPSGIATYSQAGAQFGFNMLWTLLLTYPLMSAIQLISARIGRVTGCGLAANIGAIWPRPLVVALVVLLFAANTINIGANLTAKGASVELATGTKPSSHDGVRASVPLPTNVHPV